MNDLEKAKEIAVKWKAKGLPYNAIYDSCLEMAQWKDEKHKVAYVVTRSEEHCDYVEKVFFDKEKAEEYCKPFNEDENSYHRDITKIEVTL